ncbi:helix-turn-helix domain-containing protein [Amycolatopsis thermophila]|uniref:DNA-binding transcriptional MerR regulator n=1 Tax=Amycolatopsis thermophila TaxID=206084 RepID=A0ABU0ETW7_9PSEU|nr:MerR family transcriptional regulator [Amycolatopsis thermophila]MDQ0378751.1 DNA-binding transcriptional MerR regulator [Amycolatopsis thermophila]
MERVGGMFTIGELSRRTGLPVKTIRFYSDEGLLPPADRTRSGYRLYDVKAMARLELIKTLRELGLGLADVGAVLSRETSVSRLAHRHIDALDEQIRRLRLRRAVLRAVVKRKSEPEEVKLMNKLASMSDEERARLVDEFWREVSEGLAVDPEFYERMRSAKPQLPDDPTPEQLEAWIEFAELIQDPGFRAAIRRMSERHSDALAAGEEVSPPSQEWCAWSERAQKALDAGLAPDSAEGRALADDIARGWATTGQDPDDRAFRDTVADRIAAGTDVRAERYWQLMAIMNDWPPVPSRVPAVQWMTAALRK